VSTDTSGKTACVLSSGGMRGAYQLGVLKAMYEKGMAFDLMVGASVGACNAARYAAEQIDLCIHIWLYHCANRRTVNPYRALWPFGGRPVMDLHYMFHDALGGHDIDLDKIAAGHTEIQVAVVLHAGLKTVFKTLTVENLIPLLTATCAAPYVYNKPAFVDGQRYLDGGLLDPIPLRPALDSECSTIYVVAVRSQEEVEAETRPGRLVHALYPIMTPVQKALVDRSAERAGVHNALAEGRYDDTGKTIHFIRPTRPLPVGRLTIDRSRIRQAVDIGYQDGLLRLARN